MTKTMTNEATKRLATALRAHERAKVTRRPEDNPFHDRDLTQMTSVGLVSQDKHPAVSMAPKGGLGYEMEVARFEALKEDKADKSAKRMAAARARAARKEQFDKIMESPVRPSAERMREAWAVMAHMFPTVVKAANAKRRWAARHLGDVTDDVAAIVLENMALMLAKSDKDLDLLEQAAKQIAEQTRRTGQLPGEQLTDDERKERRRIGKARKWLMQVTNNRVMDTLIDVYFRSHNLKWDNIDRIASVMAHINGPGDDPIADHFKASRAPAFMGTRFQRPGGVDASLLATAINAAITERRLDRLVELLLNNTRTDGAFPWSDMAEEVFMTAPNGDGEWMWQVVCQSTTGRNRDGKEWTVDRARKARADAARQFVRNEFEWLPGFIVEVIESFDPHLIGYTVKSAMAVNGEGRAVRVRPTAKDSRVQAVMASDFELYYLPEQPAVRQPLRPVLRYANVEEAAQALIEHLSDLVTGSDVVRSLVNA